MCLRPFTPPVYAGFGVHNFVQAGDFEAISTSPLALVHVIPEGKNYLQELPQTLASDEFFGCQKNGFHFWFCFCQPLWKLLLKE